MKKIVLSTVVLFMSCLNPLLAQEKENSRFWSIIEDYLGDFSVDLKGETRMSIEFPHRWKFKIGNDEKWASPALDDSRWIDIRVPYDWEDDGFNGYDGYAWYRITFDGRKLNPKDVHYLNVGYIDDVDATYINGYFVGKSGGFPPKFRTAYNAEREYFISNDLINFKGENVVAVKVYDEYHNGGIVKGRPGIYVANLENKVSQQLQGVWKFSANNHKGAEDPSFSDENWDDLTVPGLWDHQGYRSLDGTAWYRKTFNLTFDYESDETYYLILGQIDDFDVTYLNGQEIGETNDWKGYGDSESYITPRVYKIPRGLLKARSSNTIAVKVTDIGNNGGIYNGPVAIMTADQIRNIDR